MTTVEDKDKKIADLRSLLIQAKAKIDQYKVQTLQKEKDEEEMKKNHEKKVKMLEAQSQNIIKQYEQRLMRYQKTLQESNQLVEKHQKGMQGAAKNYEEIIKKLSGIYSITSKIFAIVPSKDKQHNEAVEELCEIQKCKEFMESMEKFQQIPDLELVIKMLGIVVKNHQQSLNKRRDLRIQTVKKETNLMKTIQQEKHKQKLLQKQIELTKKQLSQVRDKFERNVQNLAKNKIRRQQQKTNEQFVKQLLIKLVLGPKDASIMAFGILAKVLKMSEDQIKQCQKKLK